MYISIILLSITCMLLLFIIIEGVYMWSSHQPNTIKEHIGAYIIGEEPSSYRKRYNLKHTAIFRPSKHIEPTLYTTPDVPKQEVEQREEEEPIDLEPLFQELIGSLRLYNKCNFKPKSKKKS